MYVYIYVYMFVYIYIVVPSQVQAQKNIVCMYVCIYGARKESYINMNIYTNICVQWPEFMCLYISLYRHM
jgi:hypothetical protein